MILLLRKNKAKIKYCFVFANQYEVRKEWISRIIANFHGWILVFFNVQLQKYNEN
jgi:hypothetical protein